MINDRLDSKSTDAMTGVCTKDYFFKYASEIINENTDVDFCIIELDVNRLTMINDMYGLNEGDKLIQFMADTLKRVLETEELSMIARIYADLFAFLCPYSEEGHLVYINEIEDEISRFSSDLGFELLVSFGVYKIIDRNIKISSMCERANLALKSVKGNFMQHIGYFDIAMHEKALMEIEITSKMNQALRNGEFEVYFQPKHSLDDESIIGAEALVRWKTEDGRIVSPGIFIPIFETNGFITKLDFYVWEETCRFISSMQAKGISVPPISVNVSRVDLFNPDMVDTLIGLMKKYAIDPKMLRLEFTESAYAQSEQLMLKAMERFHAYGMEVEMDDFGSGYSSLNMLKDVPIDGLKVDFRFLGASNDEHKSKRILAAVIHMAKWLKIPCIVEGVETSEQIEHLKSLGCTMVQGFFYSKPIPQEEFIDYISNRNLKDPDRKEDLLSEMVIDPDSWWLGVTSDCEPVLEMHGAYILCDKGEELELGIIMASDSYYELMKCNRQKMYEICDDYFEYIHPDDINKLCNMFNALKDYHSMGQALYRRKVDGDYRLMYIKARLLEKNDTHGVYFCMIDDISNLEYNN